MKIQWLLWCVWLWVGTSASLQGREIEVKEVTISLYSRPVNGYRLVLDRKMANVTNQILRHVSSKGAGSPFQYEHTIIYENIRYAPITNDREISLYFLVRTVESQFTELTAVGMYDYKRSINPREFPELSDNMLQDLAALVRRISGDDIRFSDRVFVDGQPVAAKEVGGSQPPVETFQEEEVENHSVLVHEDPFVPSKLSPTEQLAAQNKVLRDSVKRLSRELAEINKRFVNADEVSVGNGPSEQMASLRRDLDVAKARVDVYQQRNDSLVEANREVLALVEKMGQEEAKYRPQIEELRKENTRLIEEVNGLRVRAGEKPIANPGNTERVANLERALEKEIAETRNLNARIEKLTDENNYLSDQVAKQTEELSLTKAKLAAAERAGTMPAGMRDSLQLLTMRARKADQLAEENGRLTRLLEAKGDDDSKLLREMQSMQARNATLVEERNSLEKQNAELKQTLSQTLVTLSELNENSKALLDRHSLMEQQIGTQKDAIDKMEAVIRQGQQRESQLQDSLQGEKALQGRLSAEIVDKDRRLESDRVRMDTLNAQLGRSQAREEQAAQRNKTLQAQVDSLSVRTVPLDDQQKFIREQWTKLETWDRELKAQKTALEEKEKLLARREEVLKEREGQVSNVTDKEKSLLERENALKVQEQRAKTGTGMSEEVSVSFTTLNERGTNVPIFEVRSARTYKGAQQQVAAYMNSRGLLFDEKFPDMVFDNVVLTEISSSPVTLRMRIEAFGTGSIVRVSVRKPDGGYINGIQANGGGSKVEQFLKEMFRFAQ